MCDDDRDRGSYKFQLWNGFYWEEWTGHFPSEQLAREWWEHPKKGGYFRFSENRTLGLFLQTKQIFPSWMTVTTTTITTTETVIQ